ncbi:MAG: RNA-binding protein [Veillonellaceae bacterium]|jgi:RNA-binding protein YlmH|nr:RNA-binding protein [Veillonellaceae bacterium]
MIDREKIIRYYRATGDHEQAARILDVAESALHNRRFCVTEFLDPHAYSIAETVAAYEDGLLLQSQGGFDAAERVRAVFVCRDFRGTVPALVEAVGVEWNTQFYPLTHRDVLGGLLALGIKRSVVGDILMVPGGCQIVVDPSILPFLQQELQRLGAAMVRTKPIMLSELQPRPETVKEIRSTVASLRMDSVAAAGFGVSRTQMTEDIQADKVKVNWKDAKNPSQSVKAGDVISFRGRGRVEIVEITGQTKKGRTGVLLKRYM